MRYICVITIHHHRLRKTRRLTRRVTKPKKMSNLLEYIKVSNSTKYTKGLINRKFMIFLDAMCVGNTYSENPGNRTTTRRVPDPNRTEKIDNSIRTNQL